ncbi:hypothetical protein BV22DRAFT_748473 [Leucogyrophana mollusca]|uniref:Uncharacterized protein n=1 Tax=Leucogyrophana mollusca TaxID=85980 RepID=A0ACB8B6L1_9AGAM|nr:hypothetical protein BV22DRAFT_748473 [Leucogyrophana mollusca]
MSTLINNPTGTSALPNAPDVEPDDLWKSRLKQEIEDGLQSMVDEAKQSFAAKLARAPVDAEERELLADDHLATMKNIRQLAEEQFRAALERERQERRWGAGQQLDSDWKDAMIKEQQAILDRIEKERNRDKAAPTAPARQDSPEASTAHRKPERVIRTPKESVETEYDASYFSRYAYREPDEVYPVRDTGKSRSGSISGVGSYRPPSMLDTSERLTERSKASPIVDEPEEMNRPSRSPVDHPDSIRRESLRRKTSISARPGIPEFWRPSITPEEDAAMSRTFSIARRGSTASAASSYRPPSSINIPDRSIDTPDSTFFYAERERAGIQAVEQEWSDINRARDKEKQSQVFPESRGSSMSGPQRLEERLGMSYSSNITSSPTSAVSTGYPRSSDSTRVFPPPASASRPIVNKKSFSIDDVHPPHSTPSPKGWSGVSRSPYETRFEGVSRSPQTPDDGSRSWQSSNLRGRLSSQDMRYGYIQQENTFYRPVHTHREESEGDSDDDLGEWQNGEYDEDQRVLDREDIVRRKDEDRLRREREEEENRRMEEDTRRAEEDARRATEDARRAEANRKEEEIKRREETRRKDAEAKKKAEEARRKEEEARRKEEARRMEEARRKEEEARRMEEAALREAEARRMEEAAFREAEARRKEEEIKRKEEDARRKEADVKRKEREARKKEEEARRKEEEAQRKADEARIKEVEAIRKEEEAKQKEEEARRKEEAARLKEEETRRKEEEIRVREEEVRRREDELNRREAETRRKEAEARRKEEEARRREEEARRREEEALLKAAEARRKEDEKRQEEFRRREEEIRRQRAEERKRQDKESWQEWIPPASQASPTSTGPWPIPNHNERQAPSASPPTDRSSTGSSRSSATAWSSASTRPSSTASTQPSSTPRPIPTPGSGTKSTSSTPKPSSGGAYSSNAGTSPYNPPPMSEAEFHRRQAEQAQHREEQFRQEQARLAMLEQERLAKAGKVMSKQEVIKLFEFHKNQWEKIQGLTTVIWEDFPWPMFKKPNGPDDLTSPAITAYMLSPLHSTDKSTKERIRDNIRRWHPDRFETQLLPKVKESERDKVREGAGSVVRVLNDLLRSSTQDMFS